MQCTCLNTAPRFEVPVRWPCVPTASCGHHHHLFQRLPVPREETAARSPLPCPRLPPIYFLTFNVAYFQNTAKERARLACEMRLLGSRTEAANTSGSRPGGDPDHVPVCTGAGRGETSKRVHSLAVLGAQSPSLGCRQGPFLMTGLYLDCKQLSSRCILSEWRGGGQGERDGGRGERRETERVWSLHIRALILPWGSV